MSMAIWRVLGFGFCVFIVAQVSRVFFLDAITKSSNTNDMKKITIVSPAFEAGGEIPEKYTCEGDDTVPPILIKDVPKEAKSLAIIMEDPDAPSGVWTHWVKWNMPPDTTKIEEDEEPMGVSCVGSSGNSSYEGPCPPSGRHNYVFRVYALDVILELETGDNRAALEKSMKGSVIAEGELTGLYGTSTTP